MSRAVSSPAPRCADVGREDVPFRLDGVESLGVPLRVFRHRFQQIGVEGNTPAFAGFGLAVAHGQVRLEQIHPAPLRTANIRVPHLRAECRPARAAASSPVSSSGVYASPTCSRTGRFSAFGRNRARIPAIPNSRKGKSTS